jgi:hypothetical protein
MPRAVGSAPGDGTPPSMIEAAPAPTITTGEWMSKSPVVSASALRVGIWIA